MTPDEERLRSTLASIRSHAGTKGPTGDPSWESGLVALATAMSQADIEVRTSDAIPSAEARAALMVQFQSMISSSELIPADQQSAALSSPGLALSRKGHAASS